MGINLLLSRQTKNPLAALLVLTDGEDTTRHDYNPIMSTLPDGVQCYTFGYGSDHNAELLVELAEQGNSGTFTFIVSFIFVFYGYPKYICDYLHGRTKKKLYLLLLQ